MALELINRSWAEGDREDHVLSALHLLREFTVVESGARAHLMADLKINSNDLSALRFVLDESSREAVSPRALGAHLGITSASTTALVNRLEKAGYLRREPDPQDRRGLVLHATQAAQVILESSLQRQVSALLTAAGAFSTDELATVEKFLGAVIDALRT
ncbi:MarR family winged helix-turn-helix transcriptional regulator [Arthrobacter sp. NPDC090010]|uniref:MarR family winged helix-turn-helix transcriptional regulator n=1 Tax=Arthrobacter sp. NPDC090010 TaxID=3363942 RepID=UPI00381FB81F